MIHTNRCLHCWKTEEEHYTVLLYCDERTATSSTRKFCDSGLAALDAHKEELWEAVKKYLDADLQEQGNLERKLRSILNQIEKEK